MKVRIYFSAAFLAATGLTQTEFPSRAQDADRTLTIVVGSAPGGGYDANARLLARHIGKYLPGHPSVIVKNLPGGGSMAAVRSLEATSAKDGSTIEYRCLRCGLAPSPAMAEGEAQTQSAREPN